MIFEWSQFYYAFNVILNCVEHQDHNKFDYYAFSYSNEPTNGSIVCKRVLNSNKTLS